MIEISLQLDPAKPQSRAILVAIAAALADVQTHEFAELFVPCINTGKSPADAGEQPPGEMADTSEETVTQTAPAPLPVLVAVEPRAPDPAAPVADVSDMAEVELDTDGIPWDARVHTKTKTKLAKTGQWKPLRGVDQGFLTEVRNELKAKYASADTTHTGGMPIGLVTPAAPPATPQSITFPGLLSIITGNGVPNNIVQDSIEAIGVDMLASLVANPQHLDAVYQAITLYVDVQKAGVAPETVVAALVHYDVPAIQHLSKFPTYIPYVRQALNL